ncbi:3-methyl-2-oxobutanoate hydroxymethyltransferase [Kallotenue papyrolyticum]|uniref:3-methyl-2-oxobutanoate hydroxymethyltransferase n=1 Tax=Kallotenue papyrolyticum TaxID=1325125 RepID=UPI00047859DB|nr:3-methyl-2-oxobutanoate hydroxymethyltransferase [Kallotenue papyrolyticum]
MRITIHEIQAMKTRGERIPMLTAYDYTTAKALDAAGIPLILVGDSLGMVVLGYASTVPVTLEDMLHHIKAVVRGTERALIVGDLPFLTYATPELALRNAGRLLQEGGCQAVKLEGGAAIAPTVRRLTEAGIPVMGHLGFTPQSVNTLGMHVQAKTAAAAQRLIEDALLLEQAGAFAIVLELIPAPLAQAVTERLRIPTIGIGAGAGCDGQVQVLHDLLGLYTDFVPRHAKQYRRLADEIRAAAGEYADEVRRGAFPTRAHSATMDQAELQEALRRVADRGAMPDANP